MLVAWGSGIVAGTKLINISSGLQIVDEVCLRVSADAHECICAGQAENIPGTEDRVARY